MSRRRFYLALAALAGASAMTATVDAAPAGKAAAARKAPARKAAPARTVARDWTRTVAVTPEGGFRMGNPNARVKLIEYGSLTCSHCAHFANTSKTQVAAAVRTGKVSYEFRNFVLNGIDVAATLLARCAAPASFFPLTEKLYATQPQWVGRIGALPQAQKDQLRTLADAERNARIAELTGLTQLAATAGVTPQRAKACLADPAGFARLDQIRTAGAALGVEGTPTFFVNGQMISTQEWADLEPLIRQAGG